MDKTIIEQLKDLTEEVLDDDLKEYLRNPAINDTGIMLLQICRNTKKEE